MKKLSIFLFFYFSIFCLSAQNFEYDCAMTAIANPNQPSQSGAQSLLSSTGLDFFQGNGGCATVTLNINFIFLYKDDWTGNFDFNNQGDLDYVNSSIDIFESTLTNLIIGSCGDNADYSGLSINSSVYQVNNTNAWNLDHCNPVTSGRPCYDDNDLCFNASYNLAIDNIISNIGGEHDINLYFPVEGGIYDEFYGTGVYLNSCDRPEEMVGFWTGRFPTVENLNQFSKSQIANFYLGYLWRLNRPECILDSEGNPYDPVDIMTWYRTGAGRTMAHEVGHTLSLTHYNACSNNIMSKNAGVSLLKSQIPKINRALSIKNVRNSRTNCNAHVGCAFTLSVGKELLIDYDTWIDRDIILEEGAKMTVLRKMSMANNAKIILKEGAKLIVDGGTITSCDDTWQGIKVTGGNPDFDVKFTNNATIENTSQAAVSMYPPLPWPQAAQHGNGILFADNTTFNNCKRIVEFIAFQPLFNPSYIKECVQNGGKWCITNWNLQGVEVSDNIFNDITHDCIVTSSGSFLIDGNKFYGGLNAILFTKVSAGIGSTIRDNTFNDMETGVHAIGTTYDQNRIINNRFYTTLYDVFMDGDNNYLVERNDFTAEYGVVSIANGFHSNTVIANQFDNNFIGAIPLYENGEYVFLENCFSTTYTDAYIIGNISDFIGVNFGNPANNCFTHMGNGNSLVQDMGGVPDPFTYIEPNDNQTDCRDGVLAHTNINRLLSGGLIPTSECGASELLPDNPENPESLSCYASGSITNISEALQAGIWLEGQVNSIEQDPNLTLEEKQKYLTAYRRCQKIIRGITAKLYLSGGQFQEARNLFNEDESNDAKVAVFSSYIYENDLVAAQQYLNSIVEGDEAIIDFKTVQNINLEWLNNGPLYEPSETVLNTVNQIAQKEHSYSAYAKSLYYVLTSELISSELPSFSNEQNQRSVLPSTKAQSEITSIYPNPFNDQLYIYLKGEKKLEVVVTNMFGRQIYRNHVHSRLLNERINTAQWESGIYIITISDDGQQRLQEKIVLVR